MFDVGGPEFLFLVVLALLVFGPRRLPSIGRQVGGQVAKLRRSWFELRRELEREVGKEELDGVRDESRRLGGELRRMKDEAFTPRREGRADEPSPPTEGGAPP